MRSLKWFSLLAVLMLTASSALADGTSYTGTLGSSTDVIDIPLTLALASNVTLQTYGFGGGTNQAGTPISPGGTDPFLAIFAGTGSGATILTDGLSNPFGTSLDLSNYSSFVGCPAANTVSNFGGTTCGDVLMSLSDLAAGTYTIILTDGQFIANAVFDNGTLGEGFSDLTGGVFCNTVDVNTGTNCPNTSGAYALDVITAPAVVTTPEPASFLLLGTGLAGVFGLCRRRQN